MGSLLIAAVFSCASEEPEPVPAAPDESVPALADSLVERPVVVLETPLGQIDVELWTHVAPAHAARFLELVKSGFYDGTTFHRVVAGFLIQGGDPNTKDDDPENDGYGGLEDRRLTPEFSSRPFVRGSIGMGRDHRLEGASCQFFIVVARAAHLDGAHTLFGRVSKGLDVVDEIAGTATDGRGRPETPQVLLRAWVRSK